jgi:2-(1,2-epoxy-1,2-dihydrophenyl)acetyl-CoA isomerase
MNNYQALECVEENGVLTITLNRPDQANGLNMTMAKDLLHAAQYCDYNPNVKAVIITAHGKFFCAGGDLKEMSTYGAQTPQMIKSLADELHRALSTFARMPAPVIMAVNGMAAGAGFSIAASGDIVLACDQAKFVMAYSKAGLSPDGSSSYFLPRLIGIRRTQELMLTNRMLSAEEALSWGILTRIVPSDQLLETAQKIADDIAKGPAKSHAQIKKLMLETFNNSIETQMELEARFIAECAGSSDGQEGIKAFLEKRQPTFRSVV